MNVGSFSNVNFASQISVFNIREYYSSFLSVISMSEISMRQKIQITFQIVSNFLGLIFN